MKKILFILSVALLSLNATAYVPTVNSNHQWKVRVYGWSFYDVNYSIGSDGQIMSGQLYYPVMVYNDNTPDEILNVAWIREDSLEQKVYIKTDNSEALMYDYDVQPGEQIEVYSLGFFHTLDITAVTQITMDGVLRKRIEFMEGDLPGVWIEGLGSTFGVIDPAVGQITDYIPSLSCFYVSDNLVYDNPNDNLTCGITTSTNELSELKWNVFPNPAADFINVEVPVTLLRNDVQLTIYDTAGKRVLSAPIRHKGVVRIELPQLAAGAYVVELFATSGNTLRKTLLIKP